MAVDSEMLRLLFEEGSVCCVMLVTHLSHGYQDLQSYFEVLARKETPSTKLVMYHETTLEWLPLI